MTTPGLVEEHIGGPPYAVTVGGYAVPDDALALVSIVRGRVRPDLRPEAATCTLLLATERLAQLPTARDVVTVDLSAAARAYLGGLGAGAAQVPRFRGRVTDLGALSTGDVSGPARITVVATGPRARAIKAPVGAGAWPAEDDGDRAARILAEAQAWDSSLVLGVSDPGTVNVLARAAGVADAGALLDELAVTAGGELVERRNGELVWHDAAHRRNLLPAMTLLASQVLRESAAAAQGVAGLLNDLTLTWGVGGAGTSHVVDTASANPVTGFGPAPASVSTILTTQADADSRANELVGRYSVPRWRMEKLACELVRTVPADVAAQLLALEFGQLLRVQGFPETGPFSAARLFLEGVSEDATRNSWTVRVAVTDYALTGASPLWADLGTQTVIRFRTWRERHTRWWEVSPATGPSWADLSANEPGLTWLAAAGWDVEDSNTTRWLDQPADLAWNELGATTWAAFTGT